MDILGITPQPCPQKKETYLVINKEFSSALIPRNILKSKSIIGHRNE